MFVTGLDTLAAITRIVPRIHTLAALIDAATPVDAALVAAALAAAGRATNAIDS
ncbi:MAG: hypothetical protein ACRDP8_07105 [Actinopolymorphaceae bacterium]